jgi:fructose 1,6-bisphosphatase
LVEDLGEAGLRVDLSMREGLRLSVEDVIEKVKEHLA